MDRSKWEYKKLGEVATFERGLTYSKGDEATFSSKGVLRSNNIDLDTHQLVFDEIKYLNPNFVIPESKKLKKDSIFICMSNGSKAHLGKVAFADKDYDYAFGGFMGMIVPKDIYPRYLFYYFLSHNYRNGLEQVGKGANINNLRFAQLAEFMVPTPFISDQQRIVAELDCLNEMIAVKQEQLKEFDKLAQSIFYDMFGDPVSNEKGWDIIELGTKCEVTSFKRVLIEEVVDSGIPFIRGTELMALSEATKGEQIDFTLFITPEHYERVKAISGVPKVGDLLIPSINSNGNIWILDTDEPRYYKDGRVLWVHVNHDAFSSEALKYIMHILLKKTYSLMATGATFAELKLFVLRELKVPLPPLNLQQQFADKISAIEAQKELVKQSIAETQSLFNSRMDYFFN